MELVPRVVESVGEGVEDLAAGDHVVPIFNGECGACAYCESDKTNLCGTYRVNPFKSTMASDGGTRFSVVDGSGERRPVYHFLNTSTFAEYTVLDAACAVKVHPKAPLDKMCLLSCGISTGKEPASSCAQLLDVSVWLGLHWELALDGQSYGTSWRSLCQANSL